MEITFLGVGEACDEELPNTSLLVRCQGDAGEMVLLDCGFTVPPRFFAQVNDPEALNAVWVSHFHGDHFFGLPLLLLRFREMERRATLTIVGQEGIEQIVGAAMELAYPSFRERLSYDLEFVVLEEGRPAGIRGLEWTAAVNGHSQKDLALRLACKGSALFYSGDGEPTPQTRELARECDLVVHEAYGLEDAVPGHSSVEQCLDFARSAGTPRLALVHLQREMRRTQVSRIQEIIMGTGDLTVLLPEPGDSISI